MKKQEIYDVVVIGGGASGMMAASVASANGARVLLLEKNEKLGEKLKITGGGRCNITNAEYDIHKLLQNYGDASKLLYSSFSVFGVKDTFDYFESRGLPLVVEARKRAFPKTQKANDVFLTLKNELKKGNVIIRRKCKVMKLRTDGDIITSVDTSLGKFFGKNFILAAGGKSHQETGSTGDGHKWLSDLGHNVIPADPYLVPLSVPEDWVKSLSGVSLSFMKINFFQNNKRKFSKLGKLLFTHFGLSGPLILNVAKDVADLLEGEGEVMATIDMYPDTDFLDLDKKIIKILDANKNKDLKNVIDDIVPDGISKSINKAIPEIDFNQKVHSFSASDRKKLAHWLKGARITINGLMGMDRAIVSGGGVSLDDVDMRSFRSKKIQNLYITGDLLNIVRRSGGYSLQLCWTSGFVAGSVSSDSVI